MRVRLKGIHTATKRLASGEVRTYRYAWKGGPRLEGEPGSQEFHASYSRAVAARVKPKNETLQTLVAEFRASSEYKRVRPSTKRDYDRYMRQIEDQIGSLDLGYFNDPGIRGKLKSWRDRMAETPRKADLAWSVLARILSVAKDRGRIKENPATRGGRPKKKRLKKKKEKGKEKVRERR